MSWQSESERGCSGMEKLLPPSPRGDEEEEMSNSTTSSKSDEEDEDPIQLERALAEDNTTVEWLIDEFKTGSEDLWELSQRLEVEEEGDEEGVRANQLRNRCGEIAQLLKGPAMGSLRELEEVKLRLRTAHGRAELLERENQELETQVNFLGRKVKNLNFKVMDLDSQLKAVEDVTYFQEWKKTELTKRVGLEKEVEELRGRIAELEQSNEEGRSSSLSSSDPVPVDGNATEPLPSTSSTPPMETRSILRRKGPSDPPKKGSAEAMTGKENQDQNGGAGATEGIPSSGSVKKETTLTLTPDGLQNGRKTVTWWGDSRKDSVKGKRFSDASMIVAFWREPAEHMQEQEMGGDNASAAVDVNDEDLAGSSGEVTNGDSRQAEQEVEVTADGADDDRVTDLAMGGVVEESGNAARTGIEDACAQVPQPGSQPQTSAASRLVLVYHNAEGDGDLNSEHGHDDNVGSSMTDDKNLAEGAAGNLDVVGGQCDTGIDSGADIVHGGGVGGNDVEIGEDADALASTSSSIPVEKPYHVHVEGAKDDEDSTSPPRHGGDETATGTRATARAPDDVDGSAEDKTVDDDDDEVIYVGCFSRDNISTGNGLLSGSNREEDGNVPGNDGGEMVHEAVVIPPPPPGDNTPTGNGTDQDLSGFKSEVNCQDGNAPGNDGGEMVQDSGDPPPLPSAPPKRTYELRRKRKIPYNLLNRGALVAPPPQKLKKTSSQQGHKVSVVGSRPMFQCGKCDSRFGRALNLDRHIKDIHHRQAPDENPKYECSVCPRVYFVKENYDKHVRSHAAVAQGPVKCPECSQIIKYKWDLKNHMLTHDPNRERSFKCELCPKMFFSAKNLQTHKNVHINTRQFKCKNCPMSFKWGCHLNRHMLVHSNVRRFRCTLCDQSFKHQQSLKLHLQRHGEERHFQCKECGKGFKTTSNLGEHVHRVHSGKKPSSMSGVQQGIPLQDRPKAS